MIEAVGDQKEELGSWAWQAKESSRTDWNLRQIRMSQKAKRKRSYQAESNTGKGEDWHPWNIDVDWYSWDVSMNWCCRSE